jgi:oligosaccharide amylase
MPRDIPIGNGRMLAAFDVDYRIRDFYFPHVGKENHALGYPWRLGVWVDGKFSWVSEKDWRIERAYVPDALVTCVVLSSPRLPVRILFNDVVDYEKDLLLRRARVQNLTDRQLDVRLFFHSDLNVMENETADTVFFDPKNACLIHYKGPRYFLMSCATEQVLGVTHYATGRKRQVGLEGVWRDAEDGKLSGNAISQGAVDSAIGLHLQVPPGGKSVCYYWLAAGQSYSEVEALHRFVTLEMEPDRIIERNIDYWRRWVHPRNDLLDDVPAHLRELFKRSLLVLRTQIDDGGAIIAANDTDIWQFNLDTYSYMWPRDGAIVAQTLDRTGYGALARRFLDFCTDRAVRFNYSASILAETGFLMHKYNPDGSVGSSWHPWMDGDEIQFPIQEDETALVVWAVWHHYLINRDIESIRHLYSPFVVGAAEFLLAFRDERTKLPLPSYDLWEETRGVFTFTTATVIAGLRAASYLAMLFQEDERAQRYLQGAAEVKEALETHLFNVPLGRFARGILHDPFGGERLDTRVDASLLGLALFGALDPADPRIAATAQAIEDRLWVRGSIGGVARYEGDAYQRAGVGGVGNPWVICTLWLAQYRIALARDRAALDEVLPLLNWAADRAFPSGVLPEQVDPKSGSFLSVSPLTWSHGTFVAAVLDYVDRLRLLRQAKTTIPDAMTPVSRLRGGERWT